MEKPTIVFFGTSEFAIPTLEALVRTGYTISSVITTPPKPSGRTQSILPSPVKIKAESLQLSVLELSKLDETTVPSADLFVIASYGKFLPESIISLPRYGTLNIHPSLLPLYRGPSPIQTSILNGDTETGITLMLTDKDMDHGPILFQKKILIKNTDSSKTLSETLAHSGAELLIEIIPKLISETITPTPQEHEKATFTKIITKNDGKIDWTKPAKNIINQIRAYISWPGSWTKVKINEKSLRIKILKAQIGKPIPNTTVPGTVQIDQSSFQIATKDSWLIVEALQPESRNPMSAEEFLRGYK